mgnify:CR=1 FL=1
MTTVAEILKTKPEGAVHTIGPEATVFEAVSLMAQKNIGALLVVALASIVRAEPSSDPPDEAVLATLPFDPAARPRSIVIDLAPKGNARRLPFQLDTGANTSVVSPRLARSMGVAARRVVDPQEVAPALREAMHQGGPRLVEIMIADGFGT